jgi:hypothetical protein
MWELLEFKSVWFLIVAVLATEAITNLLVKSEFSNKFIKKPLFNKKDIKFFEFLHDLLDCGYCTSVWVAIVPGLWYANLAEWLTPILFILVIHRLSNIAHFIIDLIDEKRPRDL